VDTTLPGRTEPRIQCLPQHDRGSRELAGAETCERGTDDQHEVLDASLHHWNPARQHEDISGAAAEEEEDVPI
jgi:hypothetical protein